MCDMPPLYVLSATWLISKRDIPRQKHEGKKAALHAHLSSMPLERTCSMMPRRKKAALHAYLSSTPLKTTCSKENMFYV